MGSCRAPWLGRRNIQRARNMGQAHCYFAVDVGAADLCMQIVVLACLEELARREGQVALQCLCI